MANETYYKVVKLKTGESILCTMDRDISSTSSENFLKLNDPVEVIQLQERRSGSLVVGENYVLRPWMGLSDNEMFTINSDIVLTIGDLKKEVREHYIKYIDHTQQTKMKQEQDQAIYELLKDVNYGNEVYIIDEDEILNYGDHDGKKE